MMNWTWLQQAARTVAKGGAWRWVGAGVLACAVALPLGGSDAQPAGRGSQHAAATPMPAPGAAATTPERTIAQFGDWSVTCTRRETARNCEMAMAVRNPARQTAAALAIGRVAPDAPLRLVAQVPVNTLVAQPMTLLVDGAESLSLPFQTCNRLGCFAEIALRDEAVLRRLNGHPADQASRLEWRDAAGQVTALPVSFRGFSAASAALAREQR